MNAAPTRVQEMARVAALGRCGLASGAPDPCIEELTQEAARLLERPLSAMTLIGAEFQVTRFGSPSLRGSLPRAQTFCDAAIRQPGKLLVVEDARADPRFAGLPMVQGATGLRFYAGKPVCAPGGQPVGALCVLDRRPGQLSPGQHTELRRLAAAIEARVVELSAQRQDRQSLVRDLRLAAAADAFDLHWQPILRAKDLCPHGYEALVRWNRSGHGAVAPDRFIPLAERSGLIGRIDTAMLRSACKQAVQWSQPLAASVNFSASWVRQTGMMLPRLVENELAQSGLDPGRLMVEITESVLIDAPEFALAKIQALKSLGVRVALDDFGAGYSSLGYLERYPFDVLKIDRSFLQRLGHEPRAEVVLRATLRLGRELGMTVCAEGVEEPEQLAFLQQEGCDLVQGYLLGRPRDAIDPAG